MGYMLMSSPKQFQPNGPETKYPRTYDAQVYPVRIPYSGKLPGRTRVSVKFGRFKVRGGELKTENVSEEKSLNIDLPAKILLTSSTIKEKIEVCSDVDKIRLAAIEGVEYSRAKLLESEKKPAPAYGISLTTFLEQSRSGATISPDELRQMAEKIRVIKMDCLGLGDTATGDSPRPSLDLAIIFSNIEMPEMIGIISAAGSEIQFSDFDGNQSALAGYNRDRHAKLTVPIPAILLGKAIISFE